MKKYNGSNAWVTPNGEVFIEEVDGTIKEAKRYTNRTGKETVYINVNGQRAGYAIDSLVMRVYGNVPDKQRMRIRHINGDLLDNRLNNLVCEDKKVSDTPNGDDLREEVEHLKLKLTALNEWAKLKIRDLEERAFNANERIDNWAKTTYETNKARQEDIEMLVKETRRLDKNKKNKLFIKKEK